MVDKERRDAIKKIGLGIGGLALGGTGSWQGWEWWSDRDNRIDPETMEAAVVKRLRNKVDWEGKIRPGGIEAELEPVGETAKGGTVYDASVTAPAGKTSDVDCFCDYVDDAGKLADALFREESFLFRGLYNVSAERRAPVRRPEEDQIQSYTVEITDGTGAAGVTFDAETAGNIAKGGTLGGPDTYEPFWRHEEKGRFRKAYRDHFTVRDTDTNRINTRFLEQRIETQLQAADVDAYDAIVLGGIDATLDPVDHDGDATIYEANIEAPISQNTARTPCGVAGNRGAELELAGDLADDAEKLFDGLYDASGRHRETVRDEEDDRIRTYRITVKDGDGTVTAALDARTVDRIARRSGSPSTYEPDNANEHARFRQAYFDAVDVSC